MVLRKGLAVHNGIIDAYLNGLTRDPEDKVIVFDILPNRPACSACGLFKSVGVSLLRFEVGGSI